MEITFEHTLRMMLELSLGISIKLMCENGRIHWRDFVNDLLFWLPGVRQQEGDGLSRQAAAQITGITEEIVAEPLPLAAK